MLGVTLILFCSFQHFSKILGQRAVAYLNLDMLLEGTDFLRFKVTPMLYPVVISASKKVL